jgi:hypothetical protein
MMKLSRKSHRRSHRRRGHRGGSGLGALNPASVDASDVTGQGSASELTNYGSASTDVQIRAGMTGGRRRRHRGGTTKITLNPMDISDPMNRALMA